MTLPTTCPARHRRRARCHRPEAGDDPGGHVHGHGDRRPRAPRRRPMSRIPGTTYAMCIAPAAAATGAGRGRRRACLRDIDEQQQDDEGSRR